MRLVNLPNILTLLNLSAGCIGIKYVIEGNYEIGYIFIFVAVFFDFFDGFAARLLKIKSEIGKQLDSLADVVSFGVLPAFIMFEMLSRETTNEYIPFVSIILALFAALRLAKFNIDERQSLEFYGLPTPSMALFISTLPFASYLSFSLVGLIIITIAISFLMISEVRLFSFKFQSYGFKENIEKYVLLIIFIVLFFFFKLGAIPLTVISYVFLSELKNIDEKRNKS